MDGAALPERDCRVKTTASASDDLTIDTVMTVALDGVLAATRADAAHAHLFDHERGKFGEVVERGHDLGASALLRAIGQDIATLATVMNSHNPRRLERTRIHGILSSFDRYGSSAGQPDSEHSAASAWEITAISLRGAKGQPVGVGLFAGPQDDPALTDWLRAGLDRQLGSAAEQVRLFRVARARLQTELDAARADITAQTARIHTIVTQAAEAIYSCDASGQITLANLPAARMFGFASPAEMLRPVAELASRVNLRAAEGDQLIDGDLILHQALITGTAVKGSYAISDPRTGEESYQRISAAPLLRPDGSIQGAVAVASDISALVELQRLSEIEAEAAKHERQRLQAIIDALADPVCVFDADWRLLIVNQRLIQMLGLPADIVGRHATELDDLAPGRFVQMEATELVASLEQRARAAAVDEVTVGEPPRVFRRAASGVYDETGQPIAFIFLYHDITPMREVEQLKDEFLATISHDLRSPLHHIKGYTSSLLRQDVEWDVTTRQQFLNTIDREADRMARLVGNLLDLSHLEAGDDAWLTFDSCDLGATIRLAVERIREATQTRPIILDLSPTLPLIPGDARWLEQLMANLLDNAVKYSPAGSPIAITARPDALGALLSVTDHGIGISAEHLADIFARFYRVPNGSRVRGTGLGLAICQRIVTAHGGQIWAESEFGHGSTFFVRLPGGKKA